MNEIITDLTLFKPAEPLTFLTKDSVDKTEGEEIIKTLKEFLAQNEDIIAITAPQLGINKRICAIRFQENVKIFINPIITKKDKYTITIETFASMPGKEILITRPEEITLVYYTDEFKYEDNKLLGPAARIFDQQYQLLDGITPNEFGLVSDVAEVGSLNDATEDELKEIITFYKDTYIPTLMKKYNEAIENDQELQKTYKQLKFTEDVINGRAQVVANNTTDNMNRAQRRAAHKLAKSINNKLSNKKRGK